MALSKQWLMLVNLSVFIFMCTLDASIVNISLPVISGSLAIPMNQVMWITAIYVTVNCMFMVFFGRLSDFVGKTSVFRAGAIVFTLGSLLCGLSHHFVLLLLARFIQAVGAAMTMSTSFGIVSETFPQSQRGKALGIIVSFVSLGHVAGPGVGGLILSHFDWHWIFLINIPIGIVGIGLMHYTFPKAEKRKPIQLDYQGSVLLITCIGAFSCAIFIGQNNGFSNLPVLSLFALALLFAGLFIYAEKKTTQPLIELKIFSRLNFRDGLLCVLLIYTAMMFFNVLMPFYLQKTLAMDVFHAGLLMMSVPFVMIFLSPVSGALADKINPDRITFIGAILVAVAFLLFTFLSKSTPIYIMVVIAFILGSGVAIFQSPNNSLIMSSAPADMLGVAGSLNAFMRNIGIMAGVSFATTSLYTRMSMQAGTRVTTYVSDDLFINGMQVSFFVAFLISLVAVFVSGRRMKQRK